MITVRPPSLVKTIDSYWSKDPAFEQLADDATDDQVKGYVHRWKVARETGDYSGVLVAGALATKFVLRPLKAEEFAALSDMNTSGHGSGTVAILAFRIALQSVSNLGDIKVSFEMHSRFNNIATLDFLASAGLEAGQVMSCAVEIGSLVLERAMQIRPLS